MEILDDLEVFVGDLLVREVDLLSLMIYDYVFEGDCFGAVVGVGRLHHEGQLV